MITPPVLLATAVGVVLGALVALAVSAARERARQALANTDSTIINTNPIEKILCILALPFVLTFSIETYF